MAHLHVSPITLWQLHEALLKAFPFEFQLEELSLFGIGEPLNNLIGASAGRSEKALKLIQFADSQNKVGPLLDRARKQNSNNEYLKKAAGDFLVHGEVEALVNTNPVPFSDPEVLRDLMAERERAVCRIVSPMPEGTGFLVGNDLVLTCFHVLRRAIHGTVQPGEIELQFGYRVLADGEEVQGEKFRLAEEWLIAQSPINELDFALVRLSEAAQGKVMGTFQGAPSRRKIDLKQHRDGEVRNTVIALQHPEGWPLKVTFGSVTGVLDRALTYTADTLPGSSGSPIILNDCVVTALHRQRHDIPSNAGIRISKIIAQLSQNKALMEEL